MMSARTKVSFLLAATVVVLAGTASGIFANGQQLAQAGSTESKADNDIGFTDKFFLENCHFSSIGSNRFFILEPSYRSVLVGEEEGENVKLTVTVTIDTKVVDRVQTRVVEERETHDDELVEISKNYFAICKETNSVFYFGEDTDIYENGKVVSHEGSWLAGKDGARAGLFMPGIVLLGSKYLQEIAPGVAMDQAQIVSLEEKVDTPEGTFKDVLKWKETTPLEPGVVEFKKFAPGVGLVQDGVLKLKEHGFIH